MLEEFFYDLSKAFDCMNHEIFLTKLHLCGIQRVSEDCFRSSVTNTKQKVEVKWPSSTQNFSSDWGILKNGSSTKINSRACIVHNIYK